MMGVPRQPQPKAARRRDRKWAIAFAVAVVLMIHFMPAVKAYADDASSASWAAWFGSVMWSTVTKFFDWGLAHVLDMVDQAWAVASPAIPPQIKNIDWSALTEWLSIANYWFPIAEAVVAAVAFYAFQILLIVYRFIKSWLENGW
jgi:hypothetical protein